MWNASDRAGIEGEWMGVWRRYRMVTISAVVPAPVCWGEGLDHESRETARNTRKGFGAFRVFS